MNIKSLYSTDVAVHHFRSAKSAGLLLFVVAFATCFVVGCSTNEFGPIGAVSGTLTMDDEPVIEGTKVLFMHPVEGHAGFGLTDADGKFSIEWRRNGTTFDGVPVGGYEVMIVESAAVNIDELTADEMLEGKVPDVPRTRIPIKYLRASTSGLNYQVKEGENEFNIAISSK